MKIFSSIIVFIGLIAVFTPIYSFLGGEPLGGGYFTMFIGVPLILIGLTSFFSTISATLIFVGMVVYWVAQISSLSSLVIIGLIITIIGLLYGIIEGVYKIVKK